MKRLLLLATLIAPFPVSGEEVLFDPTRDRVYSTDPKQAYILKEESLPKFLFHWTTLASAESIAENGLQKHRRLGTFTQTFPCSSYCLFAAPHPLEAIMATKLETYGGEVLLALEIDPQKAKAVRLEVRGTLDIPSNEGLSPSADEAARFTELIQGANLIHHRRMDGWGSLLMQEWVLLDPTAVKAVSADPAILGPMLTAVARTYGKLGHFVPKSLRFQDWRSRDMADAFDTKFRREKVDYFRAKYIFDRNRLPKELLQSVAIEADYVATLYSNEVPGLGDGLCSSWLRSLAGSFFSHF